MEKMKISEKKSPASLSMVESNKNGQIYEGSKGAKCKVEVNYTKIIFDQKNLPKIAYHYDVTFDPDSPKKMLPVALQTFMKNNFKTVFYAFNGRKNLYTKVKLMQDESAIFEKEVEAKLLDRTKTFKVKIKLAATVDLSVLLNHNNPVYSDQDKPAQAIQVLDVILRSAFSANLIQNRAVQAGRGLYFPPDGKEDRNLGDGMELWFGL